MASGRATSALPGEQRHELLPARESQETAERLEYRQVGLAGAAVLDTLPVGDEGSWRRAGSGSEVLDDGRLADARFPGDEDESPGACLGLFVQAFEGGDLPLATAHGLDELTREGRDRGGPVRGAGLLVDDVVE